ncbi:hypothetical protein EVA_09370 [gut metagenome]|uniref:DUF3298 domain-containing protein n=1 Tax=gut metagenome TaxID=749906 RepID=J9GR34_9ZZZZ
MKKKIQSVSLIVVLLAASGIFFSCDNIMNKKYGALETDSIHLEETTHLFGDTAKPACQLTVNLAYITQADRIGLKDSLNRYFLSTCLGEAYENFEPRQAIANYAKRYAHDYRTDLEPSFQKETTQDDEEIGAWYSYYLRLTGEVVDYEKHLLVYQCNREEYTGGAHGMYTTTFLNLNLRTLTPIRLEHLFVPDAGEALTDLLWNQLMADNQVATREELEDLGYTSTGDLIPTENFHLNKKGITFYYNVYEIAPYVMGPIQITLPWEMVRHLLNTDVQLPQN